MLVYSTFAPPSFALVAATSTTCFADGPEAPFVSTIATFCVSVLPAIHTCTANVPITMARVTPRPTRKFLSRALTAISRRATICHAGRESR